MKRRLPTSKEKISENVLLSLEKMKTDAKKFSTYCT